MTTHDDIFWLQSASVNLQVVPETRRSTSLRAIDACGLPNGLLSDRRSRTALAAG
jgi:hypothetical protein